MKKWIQILIGLILLIAAVLTGVFNLYGFGQAALIVLKGGILWIIALIGVILILLGISELKED